MTWILDCSFAASLFLPDEKNKDVTTLFEKLSKNDELLVPSIWWYEITNVLIVSVRRNRLQHSEIVTIVDLFEQLEITTDKKAGPDYSTELYDLSQLYQLPAYDSAYLELAMRKKANLASLDDKLCEAAQKAGIATNK